MHTIIEVGKSSHKNVVGILLIHITPAFSSCVQDAEAGFDVHSSREFSSNDGIKKRRNYKIERYTS